MKDSVFRLKVVVAVATTIACLAVGATEYGPNLIVNADFNITQTTLPGAANNAASDTEGFSCEGWSSGLDIDGNPTTFVITKYGDNGYGNIKTKPPECADYLAALRYDVLGVRLRQNVKLDMPGSYQFALDCGRQEIYNRLLEPCSTKVELVRLDAEGCPTSDIKVIAFLSWCAGDDRKLVNRTYEFEIAERGTYELRFRNVWVPSKDVNGPEVVSTGSPNATMCIDNLSLRQIDPPAVDSILVTSYPACCPVPAISPARGETHGYIAGEMVTCKASARTNVSDRLAYVCTGWRLYETVSDNLLATGQGTVCSFTFPEVAVTLEWQMEPKFRATSTFKYCSCLTVAGYVKDEALENFPLLVRISPARIEGFRYKDAKGPDSLAFADPDGTPLTYEVDTWNPDGESLVWVKTKRLSRQTADKLFFYWGGDPTANVPSDTWSEYASVWHFDDPGDVQLDSTVNCMTQTCNIAGASEPAAGVVGNGAAHTANYQSIVGYMDAAGVVPSCHSASGWYYYPYLKSAGSYNAPFKFGDSGGGGYTHSWFLEYPSSARLNFCYSPENVIMSLGNIDPTQSWLFFTVVCEGKSVQVYFDGELVQKVTLKADMKSGTYPCRIDSCKSYLSYHDEVRVRNAASSAGWVWADYQQAVNPNFVTAAPAEKVPRGLVIFFQ